MDLTRALLATAATPCITTTPSQSPVHLISRNWRKAASRFTSIDEPNAPFREQRKPRPRWQAWNDWRKDHCDRPPRKPGAFCESHQHHRTYPQLTGCQPSLAASTRSRRHGAHSACTKGWAPTRPISSPRAHAHRCARTCCEKCETVPISFALPAARMAPTTGMRIPGMAATRTDHVVIGVAATPGRRLARASPMTTPGRPWPGRPLLRNPAPMRGSLAVASKLAKLLRLYRRLGGASWGFF